MITDEEWLEMLDYEFKLVCKAQREYCLYTTQYNHIDIGCTKEELDDFLLYCKEYKIIISNYNAGMIALKIEDFKEDYNFFKKLINKE